VASYEQPVAKKGAVGWVVMIDGETAETQLGRKQDDHGAIAVESGPGCESLGVCRSRVYDLMRTGALPSVKIGRARRVPVSAVRAYVDQLTNSQDLF